MVVLECIYMPPVVLECIYMHPEDYHDAELQVRELSSMQNSLLWWNMDSINAAS